MFYLQTLKCGGNRSIFTQHEYYDPGSKHVMRTMYVFYSTSIKTKITMIAALIEKLTGPWLYFLTLSVFPFFKRTNLSKMNFSKACLPFAKPKLIEHANFKNFVFIFGSNRSPKSPNLGSVSVCVCVLYAFKQ